MSLYQIFLNVIEMIEKPFSFHLKIGSITDKSSFGFVLANYSHNTLLCVFVSAFPTFPELKSTKKERPNSPGKITQLFFSPVKRTSLSSHLSSTEDV